MVGDNKKANAAVAAAAASEAARIARLVHDFCWDWAPKHLTSSEHTLRGYRATLTTYLKWLRDERGVTAETLSASDFSAESVEGWLAWLAASKHNKPATCNVRLSSLRAFCRYAAGRDASFATLATEVAAVPRRRAPKAKVCGLTRDAVRALAHAPGTATRQGVRDTTLIVVLYATACRIGELLSLRVSDLRLDGATPHAVVTGKGNRARVAYLPDKAVGHLRAYLADFHGDDPDPDAFLFYSRLHPAGARPLSPDAVTDMLHKHAAAAREECPDVPAQTSRRTAFATPARATWLEDGMSVAQVSLLLGHASIQTTMDYLDVTVEAKSRAMQAVPGAPDAEPSWKGEGGADLLRACGLVP